MVPGSKLLIKFIQLGFGINIMKLPSKMKFHALDLEVVVSRQALSIFITYITGTFTRKCEICGHK